VRPATREIPLARPYLDDREEELVLEVLRSGRLSLGPTIEEFERLVAERVGAPYAAAVSSGTAGLHLLCRAAGIRPGDEVITSTLSFAASANCFIFEGGVVTAPDEETLQLVVSMRNQGREYAGGGWFDHVRLGFNYRWTDLQAAVGIAQLEKLDRLLELRSAAAERYGELLRDVDGVETLAADDADHKRSWFVYVVALAPELDRDAVMAGLRREGVATAEYIPCIHLQPYMRRDYGFAEGLFPVAEGVSRRTLALPFYPQIEPADQERVVEVLAAAVAASG
jgi:perosamine synthetase